MEYSNVKPDPVAGAGHWLDFYLETMRADSVIGIDISTASAESLRQKHKGNRKIRIIEDDISRTEFDIGEKFDIINAIGVIFHIVDDSRWQQAIKNLASHLKHNGFLIVGGQFGWITTNVQFHSTDSFEEWNELMKQKTNLGLVNKRIRSLRKWKTTAKMAGLRVVSIRRTQEASYIYTPENNILVLTHER